MKHGFVKTAAASPELRIADPAFNAKKIVAILEEQALKGTEILVFPELCLSGYTCGDLFLEETLLSGCLDALKRVAKASEGKRMLVFLGLPLSAGGKLFNCAAAVSNGKILGFVPKSYLPNYGEFYERRYFSPAPDERLPIFKAELNGEIPYLQRGLLIRDETHPEVMVGCEICEDLWAPASPSEALAMRGASVIVNLSASNETVGKREYRKTLLAAQSGKCLSAYVYADAGVGESVSDMVFAGNNLIYENGVCLAESLPFSGETAEAEVDVEFLLRERRKETTFSSKGSDEPEITSASFIGDGDLTLRKFPSLPFVPQGKELERRCGLILSMQSSALARRILDAKAKTVVLGLSGGLDSSLALLVSVRAFDLLGRPRSEITAVTMPGFGTTSKTKNNANSMAQALGVSLRSIPIGQTIHRHFKEIEHDPEKTDVTYENSQARYRTMILMDLANEKGGLVVGTGDLSELALGWCTYNGDHMSMYAVNASIPKTLVKSLVGYEAKRLGGRAEIVLKSVLSTEISPELLPPEKDGGIAQKTEQIVGPYELSDFFLYCFLRRGYSPEKTYYLSLRTFAGEYDGETVKKWLVAFYKRFFSQQFKRNCMPDGVKVGSVSLSPRADWRMPSDSSGALWIKRAEEI